MNNNNLIQKNNKDLTIINNYYLQLKNVNNLKHELNLEINKLNDLKYLFQQNCTHNWDMDDCQYQTPTSWTCTICGEYK